MELIFILCWKWEYYEQGVCEHGHRYNYFTNIIKFQSIAVTKHCGKHCSTNNCLK